MNTVTISGKPFTVAARYAEGHVLTANEASALNQTFFENIRNNFAGKAKDGGTQDDLDAYVAQYQFGVRTGGGGGSRDPVEIEAMNLARDQVKKAISNAGKKLSDYTAKAISEAAAKLLERSPAIREKARERVAEMQAVASESIGDDILGDLTASPELDHGPAGDGASDVAGESAESVSTKRRARSAEAAE